ncbi:MAG TPA: hypothetical protein PLZ51_04325, partial [Aggregatilineales bacterium]|nr:hypothetical protein [Aggregatilineales bacterium]
MIKKLLILIVILCISSPILAQEGETPTPTPSPIVVFPTETPTETTTPSITPTLGTPTATPTPRPDVPDYIYDWREELLYPVVVYFFLVIDRPLTDFQDIQLVMTAEGEAEPRILTLAELQPFITVSDLYTEFKVIWQIPPQNPFPLNALVSYEWQITLSETEITRVPGVFAYTNPKTEWVLDVDPQNRLDLLMPVTDTTADQIRSRINPLYEQLSQNTGFTPRFRFVIQNDDYLFDPCADAEVIESIQGDIEVQCNTDVLNTVISRLEYTLLTGQTSLTSPIIPIMIETFYAPLWNVSDLPAWFKQGISMLYLQTDKQNALETVKLASRANTLFTLDQMNILDDRSDLWRSQSFVMTLYMAQRIGFPALFQIARGTSNNGTPAPILFNQTYQTAMGAPLEALLPTVNNWIFTDQAQAAASASIYAEPTPIPSATPSETAFPPTPSDTPTNTPTNTPTATVT